MVNPLEKTSKKNDIVQKGGEVSEKKSNFKCMNKSDILLGEGGGAKLMSFFQDVFYVIICQFFSSSSCILRLIFNIIACFFVNIIDF